MIETMLIGSGHGRRVARFARRLPQILEHWPLCARGPRRSSLSTAGPMPRSQRPAVSAFRC